MTAKETVNSGSFFVSRSTFTIRHHKVKPELTTFITDFLKFSDLKMWFGKHYLGSCWKDLECKVQLSAICEVDADKIRTWPRREADCDDDFIK